MRSAPMSRRDAASGYAGWNPSADAAAVMSACCQVTAADRAEPVRLLGRLRHPGHPRRQGRQVAQGGGAATADVEDVGQRAGRGDRAPRPLRPRPGRRRSRGARPAGRAGAGSPVTAEPRTAATSRPGSSVSGVPGPIGLKIRSTVAARPSRRAASDQFGAGQLAHAVRRRPAVAGSSPAPRAPRAPRRTPPPSRDGPAWRRPAARLQGGEQPGHGDHVAGGQVGRVAVRSSRRS